MCGWYFCWFFLVVGELGLASAGVDWPSSRGFHPEFLDLKWSQGTIPRGQRRKLWSLWRLGPQTSCYYWSRQVTRPVRTHGEGKSTLSLRGISSRIKWPMSMEILFQPFQGGGGEESTSAFHKKSGEFTTREVMLGDQYRATCWREEWKQRTPSNDFLNICTLLSWLSTMTRMTTCLGLFRTELFICWPRVEINIAFCFSLKIYNFG